MKVDIHRQRGPQGRWVYGIWNLERTELDISSVPYPSYPAVLRALIANGHTHDCGGWKHKMLSWHWNMHAIDGYPEWEIENPQEQSKYDRYPAFVKLAHKRDKSVDVESSTLANAWDDIATVGFYQRDWTDDSIPFVNDGETYWSGWWFATLAERDRFVAWKDAR